MQTLLRIVFESEWKRGERLEGIWPLPPPVRLHLASRKRRAPCSACSILRCSCLTVPSAPRSAAQLQKLQCSCVALAIGASYRCPYHVVSAGSHLPLRLHRAAGCCARARLSVPAECHRNGGPFPGHYAMGNYVSWCYIMLPAFAEPQPPPDRSPGTAVCATLVSCHAVHNPESQRCWGCCYHCPQPQDPWQLPGQERSISKRKKIAPKICFFL